MRLSISSMLLSHHRVCSDNGSVADMDTRHHRHVLTDPYIIAYDGISLQRQFIFDWCNGTELTDNQLVPNFRIVYEER